MTYLSYVITKSDIKFSNYSNYEGPQFIGDHKNLKVQAASINDSFAQKVVSITAAAEGGSFSSINMYDSGLASVGALQFIDVAPQFGVTNMLGEVAEECGLEPVLAALEPALKLSQASFSKIGNGKWRFFIKDKMVDTVQEQRVLYFGDINGNAKGTFTPQKVEHAKTWAACLANIWYIPGSTKVQT